jgi:hypothetical protein
LPSKIGGEVKNFDPVQFGIEKKDVKKMDYFVQYGVAASLQAVADAKLDMTKEDKTRVGVLIGSGIGGLPVLVEQHARLIEKGPGSGFSVPYSDDDHQYGFRNDLHISGRSRDPIPRPFRPALRVPMELVRLSAGFKRATLMW